MCLMGLSKAELRQLSGVLRNRSDCSAHRVEVWPRRKLQHRQWQRQLINCRTSHSMRLNSHQHRNGRLTGLDPPPQATGPSAFLGTGQNFKHRVGVSGYPVRELRHPNAILQDQEFRLEPYRLSLDERFEICRSIAEECIKDDELRRLLEKKPNIAAYDGFEPSGRMHIAQVCLQ